MDSISGDGAEDNSLLWSRRSVLRMLVIAGVLPPVLGSHANGGSAAATEVTTVGGAYADALRRLDKPNLAFDQIAQLVGQNHRMTFFQATWDGVAAFVDPARHDHVRRLLTIQEQEARWWRNACLLYFQTFSRRPVPEGLEPLEGTLAEYRKIKA